MGAHLTKELLRRGHDVVVLDDLSGGFRENVDERATFVEGSIVDHELVDRLFDEHGFDYCYHLAAYAAEGLSHIIRRFNYTNNHIGSVNLINASIRQSQARAGDDETARNDLEPQVGLHRDGLPELFPSLNHSLIRTFHIHPTGYRPLPGTV